MYLILSWKNNKKKKKKKKSWENSLHLWTWFPKHDFLNTMWDIDLKFSLCICEPPSCSMNQNEMTWTIYAYYIEFFSKFFREKNVITLRTKLSRHTRLTYLKVVHCTDLLSMLLYVKNWVFNAYSFGDMFPVTHTFWELRLDVVSMTGLTGLELSVWIQIFLEMNFR